MNRLRILVAQALRRAGIHEFLARNAGSAITRLVKTRDYYGLKHIRTGNGIEIGALHNPTKVGPGATLRYVDRLGYSKLVGNYSELDASQIVRPSIIDDGFVLASVDDNSQDFVIANHVLEHSPNPIQVLENWCRVTKANGLVFVTIPIAETTFDKGRTLTSIEHIIEDYELSRHGEHEIMRQRNLVHYREWMEISAPAMQENKGATNSSMSPAEIKNKAEELRDLEAEIHFHTFSEHSFRALLIAVCTDIIPSLSLSEYAPIGGEIVAVLTKAPNTATKNSTVKQQST